MPSLGFANEVPAKQTEQQGPDTKNFPPFYNLPLFQVSLPFDPLDWGLIQRERQPYSYEGLVDKALFEPAADCGRVSARCVREHRSV